ncbi:MAG: DUF3617 family protein [Desulfobacteraceae bacterium]|nr:DUF3617 family protein [Desulfobacteraceae bacterium]
MMLTRVSLSFVAAWCLLFFSTTCFGLDFNPGQYEVTSVVEMPGMPAGAIPPQTIVECMTDEDPIPKKNMETQECEISNIKQTSTTVTWDMECTQEGQKMTSQGKMIYSGDTFDGTIVVNVSGMAMTTKISGKRLGKCQ